MIIYYWSCGTWCYEEDLWQYDWMSDDYTTMKVKETVTPEEIEELVNNLNTNSFEKEKTL